MIDSLRRDAVVEFLDRVEDLDADAIVEPGLDDVAQGWAALSLPRGALVVLSMPSGRALLTHFFALVENGLVPAMVAPGSTSARLIELADAMGASAIACVSLPSGPAGPAATLGAEQVVQVGSLQVAVRRPPAVPKVEQGEVVLLTSGTSGSASGCVTSLAAMLRNGHRHATSLGIHDGDVILCNLPLHFSFALVAQAMGTLARGGRLLIAGPPFGPTRYGRALVDKGVTASALTPTQVRLLLQSGIALPPSLRVLSVGGDALDPAHVGALLAARPGGELYLTYGLTQAGPRVSTLAAHAEPSERHASVGLPIDGTRVRLEELADGSGRTQLIVESDTVMRRRIGLLEGRSADELRAPGVLATFDLFEQDAGGYLFYRGRLAEYIVRGGDKISLASIKRVATGLPGVVAARVRIERTAQGEDYDLLLATSDDREPPSETECRAYLARHVRRAELPRSIRFVRQEEQVVGYK